MKELNAEGMKYTYFTKSEGLPTKALVEADINLDVLSLTWENLINHNLDTIRLVLIQSAILPPRKGAYFLQWNDGKDLEGLDKKIEGNAYSDEDFANAVITTLIELHCVRNGDWRGYGLVLRVSDAYLSNPKLEDVKLQSRRAVGEPLTCPVCGSNLHQFVVKLF
jgi:hypothetical protein